MKKFTIQHQFCSLHPTKKPGKLVLSHHIQQKHVSNKGL
jgi:hypothetical protein